MTPHRVPAPLVALPFALLLIGGSAAADGPAPAAPARPAPMRGFTLSTGSGRVLSYQSLKSVEANGATTQTRTFQVTPKTNAATGAPTGRSLSWSSTKRVDAAGHVTERARSFDVGTWRTDASGMTAFRGLSWARQKTPGGGDTRSVYFGPTPAMPVGRAPGAPSRAPATEPMPTAPATSSGATAAPTNLPLPPELSELPRDLTPAGREGTRSRFHLVREHLLQHLTPAARRNVASVGEYRGNGYNATAFVVYQYGARGDGSRRALVMTNHHVAGPGTYHPGDVVDFGDSAAKVVRLVASSKPLDYALVEVELPRGARVETVAIRTDAARPNERVYEISGDAAFAEVKGPVAHAIAMPLGLEGTRPDPATGGAYTIQLGTVKNGGVAARLWSGTERAARRLSVDTNIPNTPGTSGSPIFSRETHEVVAMHSSGNSEARNWSSHESPMPLIVRDFRNQLRRGRVPAELRPIAVQFLGSVGSGSTEN